MLTPKNNFLAQTSIPGVPSHTLQPALMGGQKGGPRERLEEEAGGRDWRKGDAGGRGWKEAEAGRRGWREGEVGRR